MSFYNEKFINKGRKVKYCSCCNITIEKGESSYNVPSDNFDTSYDICLECYKKCEEADITDVEDVSGIFITDEE